MSDIKGFTLYKIYYGSGLIYLGRTKQSLKSRLRGHFFKTHAMYRAINIHLVTKIEYAVCQTQADMYLYEIYYINKLKPPLNIDDKAHDDLTVSIDELNFEKFECNLMDKWKKLSEE